MRTDVIQMLLVTANQHIREQLATLLSKAADINLIAKAASAQELFDNSNLCTPDVAVIDFRLPDRAGWLLTRQLQTAYPGIRILALCISNDEEVFSAALAAGALGYLTYRCTDEELLAAIRSVYRGKAYFCAEAQELLIKGCLALG